MIVWSSIRRASPFLFSVIKNTPQNGLMNPCQALVQLRPMSGAPRLALKPNRWQWLKWKDMFYFYIWVGAIPYIFIVTLTNLFIGPAKLAPIPEGYKPQEWEYYSHPISRWIARYLLPTTQENYEKYLHRLYEVEEKSAMGELENKILGVMARKKDYKIFWHRPVTTKYHQHWKDQYEKWDNEVAGDNVDSFP